MMRVCLLVLVVSAYVVSAAPTDNLEQPSRFIEYTGEDGSLQKIDLEDVDMDLLNSGRNDADNYILFTRSNPTRGQILSFNSISISESFFNPAIQTIVLAHGWFGNQENEMNSIITEAILNRIDANVVVVDWSNIASSTFATASRVVPQIGWNVARFLTFLTETSGASFDNMHLVGFSLGAHLVGNTGRALDGRIARLTALDPAGPLWYVNPDRVGENDAQYVEAIHTDAGVSNSLGIGIPVADADFFVNGGFDQPGCITSICHHNRAWRLFSASVTYDHLIGRHCDGMVQVGINFCRGGSLNMGNTQLRKNGSGLYRVNTGWRYPF